MLTIASRIFGLLRDAICLDYFGTAAWHYFALPFKIPNLFRRLFGEGALSAALIPVYTDRLSRDEQGAKSLANSVITLLVIVLAGFTLLGWLLIVILKNFGPESEKFDFMMQYAIVLLPYMILICTVAAMAGLLNVHRHFAAPAAAPIILNVCIIGGVLLLRKSFGETPLEQVRVVAWAVLIAGALQLLLQYVTLSRRGLVLLPSWNFSDPDVKKIMRLMAPMMVGLSAMQLNTLLDDVIAWLLSATPESGDVFSIAGRIFEYPVREGAVSFLYGAQRLYQFPLGVFGVALATAIFPLLSRDAIDGDRRNFAESLSQGLRLGIFLSIPATVGMILVRKPLIAVLFQRMAFTGADTDATAWPLLFYSLGIAAYCIQQIVTRAFYAFQDSVTPVKIAIRLIGLNLLLNLLLIWPLGTGGLALSTAFCASLQVAILLRILVRRYELHIAAGIFLASVKTAIATVVMVLAWLLAIWLLGDVSVGVQVLVSVPVCATAFGLSSWLIGSTELAELFRRK